MIPVLFMVLCALMIPSIGAVGMVSMQNLTNTDPAAELDKASKRFKDAKHDLETFKENPDLQEAKRVRRENPASNLTDAQEKLLDKLDQAKQSEFNWASSITASQSQARLGSILPTFTPKPLSNSQHHWRKPGQTEPHRILVDAHKREAKHYDNYQWIQHSTTNLTESMSAEELLQRLSDVNEHATSGMESCEDQSKFLRIACEHGWQTAYNWVDPEYLDGKEDEVRLRRAISTTAAKAYGSKSQQRPSRQTSYTPKGSNRNFHDNNGFGYGASGSGRGGGRNAAPSAASIGRNTCRKCGGSGHWAYQCKSTNTPSGGQ